VAGEGAQLTQGRRVGSQAIGDDGFRNGTLVLEQFLQQFQCCLFVTTLLDEDIQNFAFFVDGAPYVHSLAVDPDDHFVQVPHAICRAALAADVGRDSGTELVRPATDCFEAKIDPPFGEQMARINES